MALADTVKGGLYMVYSVSYPVVYSDIYSDTKIAFIPT